MKDIFTLSIRNVLILGIGNVINLETESRMYMLDTRILLIGESNFDMYSSAFFKAWQKIGYQNITYFKTNEFLDSDERDGWLVKLWKRFERKTAVGNHVNILNRKILENAAIIKPQLVFVYNSRFVFTQTLKKLKDNGAVIFLYSNDDPFSDFFPAYYWRHFQRGLSVTDVGFVYRVSNIGDFLDAGCKRVRQLRSYYIEERNFKIGGLTSKQDDSPVVFLGHNENDERAEYIGELLKRGIKVGIIKKGWEDFEVDNPYLVKYENTGERYNELINRAKIALVFLSKINHDTYTRRCFEIPATKTLMIAPFTEELASMFEENKEIIFYRSKEELAEKTEYYLRHDREREQIANMGYERLMKDGHEITDRVREVMDEYMELTNNHNK